MPLRALIKRIWGNSSEVEQGEYLVHGATLRCTVGTEESFLFVSDRNNATINGQAQATVKDRKFEENIFGFGICRFTGSGFTQGQPCATMLGGYILEEKWDNTECVQFGLSKDDAITTNSVLRCHLGGIIEPQTSGQDCAAFREFEEKMRSLAELEAMFPGLFALLDDPFASLHLNEGMREMALDFLSHMMEAQGGSICLIDAFISRDILDNRILSAISKLTVLHDTNNIHVYLSIVLARVGSNADPSTLNSNLFDAISEDSRIVGENIAGSSFRTWLEGNLQGTMIAADMAQTLAFAALGQASMRAGPQTQLRQNLPPQESHVPRVNINSLPPNVQSAFRRYTNSGWRGNVPGQSSGTRAGGVWRNDPPALPRVDSRGRPITYREFDVNNRIPGAGRDAQRFVVGSNGRVYFTNNHYGTFVEVVGG